MTKSFVVVTSLTLMLTASGAHAFGNGCRNVTFSVDNNANVGITVTSFDLFSQSEGRWLHDDFANIGVPANARNFVVRRGETVEHAENDRITSIIVNTTNGPSLPHAVIGDQICVANKLYKGTF